MLRVPTFESVRALGRFLVESGYDVEHLGGGLGLGEGLHANRDNLEALLRRTEGDSLPAVLARLFFVAWPSDVERCRRAIPESILDICVESGLLTINSSQFEPMAAILPFNELVITCDAARLRGSQADFVIGPSPATHLLARFLISGAGESTLDVGTGSGVLALNAASYSQRVVGTDINERTLGFAAFNAALNGMAGVEFRCGDTFAPVNGERFSRIVANPPFFLAPAKRFTYSDSPTDLDGYSRRLAMEAPQHLEEGGFFQMICEWVELEDQPWEERLHEWTKGSDCDVLVCQGPGIDPVSYSEKRQQETILLHTNPSDTFFSERVSYLKDRKVRAVVGGVITMRKRRGANWFSTLAADPTHKDAGNSVRQRFESLTFAGTHTEQDFLDTRFRVAGDVTLEERKHLSSAGWEIASSELARAGGLKDRLGLDAVVARFIPLFDGEHTLAEIANSVSESLNISRADAQAHCLRLARRLLQNSFVTPV
jgi:methylase of polypeptide subunit release factors